MQIAALFGRVTLLGIATATVLGAAELVARLVYTPEPARRAYDPYVYKTLAPNLVDTFVITNDADEEVTVRTNALGLRGPEVGEKRGPRLVFLGGSTTENYRFNERDTFPAMIAARLRSSSGRPVEAFNAGLSGATTAHSVSRLQHHLLALQPDVVVVYHAINDLLAGYARDYDPTHRNLTPPATAGRSRLLAWLSRSRYPDFTTDAPYGTFSSPPPLGPSGPVSRLPSLPVFERNIRSMAAIADAHQVKILFVTQLTAYGQTAPSRLALARSLSGGWEPTPDVASLAAGVRRFNDVLRQVPTSTSVRVHDLVSEVTVTDELLYDDCHLTRRGNQVVAERLTPVIASMLP